MAQEDDEPRSQPPLRPRSIEDFLRERVKQSIQDEKVELDHWDRIREDELKQSLSESAHVILFAARIVIPLAMGVLSWHYMLPIWLRWLTEEQLQGLLTFLGSVTIVGVIGLVYAYIRQHSTRNR